MNTSQYQAFVMWKATNPTKRNPASLHAYMEQNDLSMNEVEAFMNHENFAKDLQRATRFTINQELPDLMWSVFESVKTKRKAQDLEALMKLLDPKASKDDAGNIFSAFDENLTDKQKEQIIKRLNKK